MLMHDRNMFGDGRVSVEASARALDDAHARRALRLDGTDGDVRALLAAVDDAMDLLERERARLGREYIALTPPPIDLLGIADRQNAVGAMIDAINDFVAVRGPRIEAAIRDTTVPVSERVARAQAFLEATQRIADAARSFSGLESLRVDAIELVRGIAASVEKRVDAATESAPYVLAAAVVIVVGLVAWKVL